MTSQTITKVLTLVTNLRKGGVQRTAQVFSQGYKRLGIDSRVLAVRQGGERAQQLERAGIPYWIGLAPSHLEEISAWAPQLVHIHSHHLAPEEVSSVLAGLTSPIVVEQNVFSRPTPFTGIVHCSFQMSRWCEWRFRKYKGMNTVRTAMVPNAANPDSFQRCDATSTLRFRERHGISSDAIVIGRIGQADMGKWSVLLLEAFAAVCDRQPEKCFHLLVVNPPPGLTTHANCLTLRERVTIIDSISGDAHLSVAYSAIDIFALAADLGESFGNVLAESLLCETPAVVLSTPWAHNSQCEVVGHNVGGLVATTPQGFITAIDLLASDPLLRRKLGTQGRQHIVRNYSFLEVAERALEYATPNTVHSNNRVSNRQVLEIYCDAIDHPNWVSRLLLQLRLLTPLMRYSTGYESITSLPRRCMRWARNGLCPPPGGT